MDSASAETYLRQFTEILLRRVRGGTLTPDDCLSRARSVAAALQAACALDAGRAEGAAADLETALAARSPGAGALPAPGRRALFSPGLSRWGLPAPAPRMTARPAAGHAGVPDSGGQRQAPGIRAVPAGTVLRVRPAGAAGGSATGGRGDEDVYLLGYVTTGERAWLAVAARTQEHPARRPPFPPSARNAGARPPAPGTFAGGGMTAADNTGHQYRLSFSGGGGRWHLGRLSLHPVPPPGITWLDVQCGTDSVRVDLTARAPAAQVSAAPLPVSRAEAYLLWRIEAVLARPALAAAEAAAMADIIPALREAGALAPDSPVPGQVAAACERLGAPGRLFATPGPLPEPWDALLAGPGASVAAGQQLAAGLGDAGTIHAARLAAVLRAGDGTVIVLSGLITAAGSATVLFGGLYPGTGPAEAESYSMWLRDDAGGWHAVLLSGWSSDASGGVSFQAMVTPPLAPGADRIEFVLRGFTWPDPGGPDPGTEGGSGPRAGSGGHSERRFQTGQIRAVIPLQWWSA
jgi:hypothetical protein